MVAALLNVRLDRETAPPCGKKSVDKVSNVFPVFQELQSKSKVCANVFCGAGRECAVTEKGEPSCLCIEVSAGSAETT